MLPSRRRQRFSPSISASTKYGRVHLASSMKDDLRYTPSDCFETFPFPEDWTNVRLEAVGQEYYEFRAALMVATTRA